MVLPMTAQQPIPHVLHQTWRDARVPRGLQRAIRSWRRLQPRWQFMFHSDADNMQLVRNHYPWLERTFQRLSGIQK